MADDIDRAAARSEEILAEALQAHQRRARQHQAAAVAEDCVDCGDEIPAKRRAAVPETDRCFICQTKLELRGTP